MIPPQISIPPPPPKIALLLLIVQFLIIGEVVSTRTPWFVPAVTVNPSNTVVAVSPVANVTTLPPVPEIIVVAAPFTDFTVRALPLKLIFSV